MLVISRFGFEGWSWVLIASVPDLCILFTFCKLFCKIMDSRLQAYLEEYDIINRCQIGFRPKSRTSDHFLVLTSIINKFI